MRHAYCTALDRGKMVSRLSSLLPLPPGCSAGMIMARSALPRLGIQTSRYIRHKTLLSSPKSRLFSSSPSLWLSAAESREGANAASDGSPRRPKAVIFDLGGVVVPSPLPIFSRFEERHGLTQGSVVKTITQTGADGSFAGLERGELTVEQFSEPFSREFRSIFGIETPSGIFKELLEDLNLNITAVSEVLEMISDLRKNGVKTALLTNNFRYDDGRTLFPNEELGVDVVSIKVLISIKDKKTLSLFKNFFFALLNIFYYWCIGGGVVFGRNQEARIVYLSGYSGAIGGGACRSRVSG